MISHLKGSIDRVADNFVVVDVGGVGYHVICSTKTINYAQSHADAVHFFTSLVIRDDAWVLFGFLTEQERAWFHTLTSVQGVGGKVAIAILSSMSESDIYNAFLNGDKTAFTRADGVGAKLATRIVTELKDKVVGKFDVQQSNITITESLRSAVMGDVLSALVNLGYQKVDVMRELSLLEDADNMTFDEMLRILLRKLSSFRN